MSSGGGKTQTQTTNNAPWKGQIPYLDTLFKGAKNLYDQGPRQYYPGETYAGMSPVSQTALEGITQRGLEGSPLNKASSSYLQDVLGGKYLNQQSPGWDAVANAARSGADSTYAGLGRYGSGAHDTAVAQAVGGLQYQDYANQLGRMDQAAALAPQVAGQDFIDLNAVNQAGQQYQGELQNQINADLQRYNYQQNAPYANLQDFGSIIGQNYGGGSQQTISPNQQTPWWQQALGGGLALGSLFL